MRKQKYVFYQKRFRAFSQCVLRKHWDTQKCFFSVAIMRFFMCVFWDILFLLCGGIYPIILPSVVTRMSCDQISVLSTTLTGIVQEEIQRLKIHGLRIIIDCEAREIMHLVASVHLSVLPSWNVVMGLKQAYGPLYVRHIKWPIRRHDLYIYMQVCMKLVNWSIMAWLMAQILVNNSSHKASICLCLYPALLMPGLIGLIILPWFAKKLGPRSFHCPDH